MDRKKKRFLDDENAPISKHMKYKIKKLDKEESAYNEIDESHITNNDTEELICSIEPLYSSITNTTITPDNSASFGLQSILNHESSESFEDPTLQLATLNKNSDFGNFLSQEFSMEDLFDQSFIVKYVFSTNAITVLN
ncbi:hypothetical protein TSAR_009706 [Trichomalopsis sarcophagae]|uniref:Uncharacterized protein n=1 Tax=Trichomalopsis sarcophagae TaxID=543379 RepID=A0A232EK59_9HYME|nr:hypothetical protein TSAR_009706 [Trichomalopsis sarcophagae]